jgi:starch phosphorylase
VSQRKPLDQQAGMSAWIYGQILVASRQAAQPSPDPRGTQFLRQRMRKCGRRDDFKYMVESSLIHPTSGAERSLLVSQLRRDFERHLRLTLAKDRYSATDHDRYYALALTVRDRLIDRWIATQQTHHSQNVKRVYYLSLEFLMGRLLGNNVINLGLEDAYRDALYDLGLSWEDMRGIEQDAGLGNGGLGRLAACFMESMSTLNLPAVGYGLRYDFGIFKQRIVNGYQVEQPDEWLKLGCPWEIAHPEFSFEVQFEGRVEGRQGLRGVKWHWLDTKKIVGMPHDLPIVGYGGMTVNTLRLWSAKAAEEFDFDDFNRGEYVEAVSNKVLAENLTKILYPNDNTWQGKELRLKQEYFFVSCSLQDALRRFKKSRLSWSMLPEKAFFQLNDTHPALTVAELMRLLVDSEGLTWDEAWAITTSCTGYTNHTILPEALEKWPVSMFERLLPRHLQIIYEINARFLREVSMAFPFDSDRLRRMSLVEEGHSRQLRMAHLAIVGSKSVNGVSQLHTNLLTATVLRDFAEYWPHKFNNKTNGITPRRWLLKANPRLARLITDYIGDKWITDLDDLQRIEPFVDDPEFRNSFRAVKYPVKQELARYIRQTQEIEICPDSLFDVQVKRLHEYKRQLMLALYAVVLYRRIRTNPHIDMVPRTILMAGKAAPGYAMAKLIIKFVHAIGEIINRDPEVNGKLRLVFLPNYRVSLAEKIIPAANLSEQISTAGTEASGTSNMKFQLNGALTIGTLDGANVEMRDEVGKENIFIFGKTADEVEPFRLTYNPYHVLECDEEIRGAIQLVQNEFFSLMEPGLFRPLLHSLLDGGDRYLVLADLRPYINMQDQVDQAFRDRDAWERKAILNVARAGKFSSDRTIREYASEIWNVNPCNVPPRLASE